MPPPENEAYVPSTLMVGIANPDTVAQLMSLASCIVREAGCQVFGTHIVTVPEQMMLSAARSSPEVAAGGELLRSAVRAGAAFGLDVRGLVEVARDVHEGLASAVDSKDADLLLVGYSDTDSDPTPTKGERAFDRIMHRLARHITAHLVVAKFRSPAVQSILVPLAGPFNLPLTALLVRAIATGTGASVHFIHVVGTGANPADENLRITTMLARHGLDTMGGLEVIRTASQAATIIEHANEHDMTIVGAARPSITDAIFGNVAEQVAAQASSTVLLIRAMHTDA